MESKTRKWSRTASMFGLAAMLALSAVSVSATIIEVDVVLKPDSQGRLKGLDGRGVGLLDDESLTLMLSEFVFENIGSPSNIPEKFDLGIGAFTLKTTDLSVEFAVEKNKQGTGIGGTYEVKGGDLLGGTWKLSERQVPEPGSLALLGVALLGIGITRYYTKKN